MKKKFRPMNSLIISFTFHLFQLLNIVLLVKTDTKTLSFQISNDGKSIFTTIDEGSEVVSVYSREIEKSNKGNYYHEKGIELTFVPNVLNVNLIKKNEYIVNNNKLEIANDTFDAHNKEKISVDIKKDGETISYESDKEYTLGNDDKIVEYEN